MIFLLRQIYYDSRSNDRQSTIDEVSTDVVNPRKKQKNVSQGSKSGIGRTRRVRFGKEKEMVEISSDIIRGYNDTMILFLLLEEPSYGYELSKQIKSLSDGKYVIKETTLYSAFSRMEKNGYIESFVSEAQDTGKKRTYYKITEEGRRYYLEKCEEWQLTKEVVERFIASA